MFFSHFFFFFCVFMSRDTRVLDSNVIIRTCFCSLFPNPLSLARCTDPIVHDWQTTLILPTILIMNMLSLHVPPHAHSDVQYKHASNVSRTNPPFPLFLQAPLVTAPSASPNACTPPRPTGRSSLWRTWCRFKPITCRSMHWIGCRFFFSLCVCWNFRNPFLTGDGGVRLDLTKTELP